MEKKKLFSIQHNTLSFYFSDDYTNIGRKLFFFLDRLDRHLEFYYIFLDVTSNRWDIFCNEMSLFACINNDVEIIGLSPAIKAWKFSFFFFSTLNTLNPNEPLYPVELFVFYLYIKLIIFDCPSKRFVIEKLVSSYFRS